MLHHGEPLNPMLLRLLTVPAPEYPIKERKRTNGQLKRKCITEAAILTWALVNCHQIFNLI